MDKNFVLTDRKSLKGKVVRVRRNFYTLGYSSGPEGVGELIGCKDSLCTEPIDFSFGNAS